MLNQIRDFERLLCKYGASSLPQLHIASHSVPYPCECCPSCVPGQQELQSARMSHFVGMLPSEACLQAQVMHAAYEPSCFSNASLDAMPCHYPPPCSGPRRTFSRINHSCKPNARYTFRGVQVSVQLLVGVPARGALTISYIDASQSVTARREQLLLGYVMLPPLMQNGPWLFVNAVCRPEMETKWVVAWHCKSSMQA